MQHVPISLIECSSHKNPVRNANVSRVDQSTVCPAARDYIASISSRWQVAISGSSEQLTENQVERKRGNVEYVKNKRHLIVRGIPVVLLHLRMTGIVGTE